MKSIAKVDLKVIISPISPENPAMSTLPALIDPSALV
jgi:hypothetical protein